MSNVEDMQYYDVPDCNQCLKPIRSNGETMYCKCVSATITEVINGLIPDIWSEQWAVFYAYGIRKQHNMAAFRTMMEESEHEVS